MAAPADVPFLLACRNQPTPRVPVWFMRQAGRSLPEYRAIRGTGSILDAVRDPELATEVTLQPVRRYGVDAAVLYSDIVVPPHAVGFGIDVTPGTGPVAAEPLRTRQDLARLRPLEPDDVAYVAETVKLAAAELEPTVPVLGFAGAPFTVASYLIEGGPSRAYARTKSLMLSEPETWRELMDRLTEATIAYLRFQVETGADAVQLFDSWAGALGVDDYEGRVLPWSRRIFSELADLGVPRIHFGVGTAHLLELMRDAGPDVVGVDWRIPLDDAWSRVGNDLAIQGNLDPAALLGPWEVVERKASDVLRRAGGRRGHVFNLGHGVLPETDPDTLARLVELVHSATETEAGP
jgi:uroporphyrinogen decarboxylase